MDEWDVETKVLEFLNGLSGAEVVNILASAYGNAIFTNPAVLYQLQFMGLDIED